MTALLVAVVMMMALSAVAMGQNVPADSTQAADKGQITVSNAAKGETYKIYKLFDATVTGAENGSIAYTGTIPDALKDYFVVDAAGNITATEAAKNGDEMSDGLKSALKTWAGSADVAAEAESDGSELYFNNLAFGYYVVTTSQGDQAISVDSTNPKVSIVDKNSTTPTGLKKSVDDNDVYIGQQVTYTVKYKTANYDGAGSDAKQIVSYTIKDTLPDFLKDVTVTSIYVDNDGKIAGDEGATTNDQTAIEVQQFSDDKEITIPWVSGNQSLYKNGAYLVITYTAVVTDKAAIAGNGNKNEVSVTWKDKGDDTPHGNDKDETVISTYGIALKKVDAEGNALAGAKFSFPFKLTQVGDTNVYVYDGAGTTKITTTDNGVIVVKGLESGTEVSITETQAPDGYNKLVDPITVAPEKLTTTTTKTSWSVDENGAAIPDTEYTETSTITYVNEDLAVTPVAVINNTGSTLPSTGGMGTTILYIVGAVLVIGAVVLLITRRRLNAEK